MNTPQRTYVARGTGSFHVGSAFVACGATPGFLIIAAIALREARRSWQRRHPGRTIAAGDTRQTSWW